MIRLAAGAAPTANNDAFVTAADTALVIGAPGVLANDTEPDGELMHVHDYDRASAAGGTVVMTDNGGFTYSPPPGFNGFDTFTYRAGDPNRFVDSGQALGSSFSYGVSLGDLDGDGDLDAFVADYTQPNRVWLNNGSGTFADSGQELGSDNSYDVSLGDLDGDGDLDAFVANDSNQPNRVWLNAPSISNRATVTLTVGTPNGPPVITSNGGGPTAAISAAENQTAVTTVASTDPDNDPRTYNLTGGADMARFSIVAGTGVLTFLAPPDFEAPTDADANNTYIVTVTATSTGGTDTQTITVTVTNVNEAPIITSNGGGASAVINAAENQTAVTTLTSIDPEMDARTYSITGGADLARFSIHSTSGVLTFVVPPDFEVPTDADVNNTYVVTVTATSEGGTDAQTLTVTVTNVNEAPSFVAPTPAEGATVSISGAAGQELALAAVDVDANDTLVLTAPTAPAWLTLTDHGDGTTALTVAPNNADPGDYEVRVVATDSEGATAERTFTVRVTDTNARPTISIDPGPLAVDEGSQLLLVATASDPDGDALTLTWDLDNDGQFDDATGPEATFTATDGPATDTVAVRASDGAGGTSTDTGTVTVVNVAPTIGSLTGTFSGTAGVPLRFQALASDPGLDTLSYTWDFGDGSEPQTATDLSEVSHAWSAGGEYTLTLTVTDDDDAATSSTRPVVIGVDQPTIEQLTGDTTGVEGSVFSYQALATDPAGGPILYVWDFGDGGPSRSGQDLTEVGTVYADEGLYTLTLTTSGPTGLATATLPVTVSNASPQLVGEPLARAYQGVPYRYRPSVINPGGDALTFGLTQAPAGMALSATGAVTWTPSAAQASQQPPSFEVVLAVVDDGGGGDSRAWTVIVDTGEPVDTDACGAPDACALQYGFDANSCVDDTEDADGDGLTLATECAEGSDPTVSNAPSAPIVLAPAHGQLAGDAPLGLLVHNAYDPDGDALTYTFELYTEPGLSDLLFRGEEVVAGDRRTRAEVVANLQEDTPYRWRARAFDGRGFGPWSEVARFLRSTANDAPTAPDLLQPHDRSLVAADTLLDLVWHGATDPEGRPLRFSLELQSLVEGEYDLRRDDLVEQDDGSGYLTVDALSPGAYLWRVQATDGELAGPWSTRFTFTVGEDSGEDVGADDVGPDGGDDAGDADLDAGTGDASDATDPPPLASGGVNTTCGCSTLDPRRSAIPFGALLLGLLAMVGLVVGVRRRRAGAMES